MFIDHQLEKYDIIVNGGMYEERVFTLIPFTLRGE